MQGEGVVKGEGRLPARRRRRGGRPRRVKQLEPCRHGRIGQRVQELMQACIHRARAAGADALTLHTTPMMAVAMRLYARLGFVHVRELDFEPAPGLTVRGFRLTLEP